MGVAEHRACRLVHLARLSLENLENRLTGWCWCRLWLGPQTGRNWPNRCGRRSLTCRFQRSIDPHLDHRREGHCRRFLGRLRPLIAFPRLLLRFVVDCSGLRARR